ncbi:CRISPR-associated endonuclease Cas1 [Candidatus Bathyarchaeota archaeon]|nr:CRISPR-associated endonuclease Cas1 [Candidatus Bathyarchaeota archaeon]
MTGKIALVDSYGAYLSVKEGRLQLRLREKGEYKTLWDVAPVELDSIVFTVDGASLSASAIHSAAMFGLDIVFLKGDRPIARLLPATYGSTMRNWLSQLRTFKNREATVQLAREFILGKIRNQRMILLEYSYLSKRAGAHGPYFWAEAENLKDSTATLTEAKSIEEILNVEAHTARIYWASISKILPENLNFTQRLPRSRMPSNGEVDPFNIALNIGYSALLKECWRAVFLAGLNPYVGFLHKPRPGRMSLVLDLMEEFRAPCVDRPLIAQARRDPDLFMKLSRRDDREPVKQVWRIVSNCIAQSEADYRNLINTQARLLAKHLRKTDLYKAYRSRW